MPFFAEIRILMLARNKSKIRYIHCDNVGSVWQETQKSSSMSQS